MLCNMYNDDEVMYFAIFTSLRSLTCMPQSVGVTARSALEVVQSGLKVVKDGYDVAAPYVKQGVDAVSPVVQEAVKVTKEKAGPVLEQAVPVVKVKLV